MSITKADILQGRNKIEYVEVEGLDEPIPIRPLTDGQYAEIEQIRVTGMKIKTDPKSGKPEMDFELGATNRQRFAADVKAVYYGLATEEKWSEGEIRQMRPPGLVKHIAKEVYRLSGVDSEKDVEEFLKE